MELLHDDRARRLAILTLVVSAHLAALLIPWEERRRATDSPSLGSLLLIPRPSEALRPPLPAPVIDRSAVRVDPLPQPNLATDHLPTETPTGSAMAPPDWKQSGADAAIDAARDPYRALGPPPKEPSVELPPPPFREPPRHKPGESDEDALKNPIIWLGENCYSRGRNYAAAPGDPLATVPMIFCSFSLGKKEARGDLFEHLRKTPPVP